MKRKSALLIISLSICLSHSLLAQIYSPEIKVQATTNNQTEVDSDLRVNGNLLLGSGNKSINLENNGVGNFYRVDVDNDTENAVMNFYAENDYAQIGLQNGGHQGFYIKTGGQYQFNVNNDGDVMIGTGHTIASGGFKLDVAGMIRHLGHTNASDIKLKKDIVEYHAGLALIEQIKPVKFKYKPTKVKKYETQEDKNGNPVEVEVGEETIVHDHERIGIIAQDIQKIAPELVISSKDQNGEETLSVSYDSFTFILINAMKEQQVMIENLQKEVKSLKDVKSK